MQQATERVYCAGPLFTGKEREEMEQLASALEEAGYSTFLPQRDGLELHKCVDYLIQRGSQLKEAARLTSRAIFALDVYQVLDGCDALAANLNGRVPDEGTVSEAAMAWSRGKTVVGYKADSRTAFDGQDNPLVAGLFAFELCHTIEDVVSSLREQLAGRKSERLTRATREEEINSYVELGKQLWSVLEHDRSIDNVVDIISRFRAAPLRA